MKARFLLFFIAIILATNQYASGQNLVPNPGFEHHLMPLKRLQAATFLENPEFRQVVSGWESLGYAQQVSLFSTQYHPLAWQEELGYNFRKAKPCSGHSMLRILAYAKGGVCGHGNSGYIQTRLSAPLVPGNTYSVGFRVNLYGQEALANCAGFTRHFGMVLTEHPLQVANLECMVNQSSVLAVDSIQTGLWQNFSFSILPSKTLNYLVVGGFYNPNDPYFYDGTNGCVFEFFIDDVFVKQEDRKGQPFMPYPDTASASFALPLARKSKFSVFFDVDSDTLNARSRRTLDSLLVDGMSDQTSILRIAGHADIRGHHNYALSGKRALAVQQYLMEHGMSDKRRFEIFAYGSDSLIGDNRTETERQMSRRVDIVKSDKTLPFVLYSQASLTSDPDTACSLLLQWLTFEGQDGLLLLHDPDLTRLHKNAAWPAIEKKVKAFYQKYRNPEASFELDNLYFRDQRFRSLGGLYQEAKGRAPAGIERFLNDMNTIHAQDSLNAWHAMTLLKKYGWMSALSVGPRQASAVFYAIQHAEVPAQMKYLLPWLEQDCKEHGTGCEYYAMMYDRLGVIEKGMQRFGTQYKQDKADPELYRLAPLENSDKVNAWRAELKMGPVDTNSYFRVPSKN